jgi:hypothetical protein
MPRTESQVISWKEVLRLPPSGLKKDQSSVFFLMLSERRMPIPRDRVMAMKFVPMMMGITTSQNDDVDEVVAAREHGPFR